MTAPDGIREQIGDAYAAMAREARYRPSAPGDGFGNIDMPERELILKEEQQRYADRWWDEEGGVEMTYWLGCPDYADRPALVYIVEAARALNGQAHELALALLRMAIKDIEARA